MPKVKRVNVLHELRMKLKSGYLKEEPPAYTFMKRYPPLNNDQNIMQRKPKHVNVTALSNLYTRAVEKNSLYADEKVYPAYWRHEPQAFTLAKKQYEHIKAGLSEEEAYKKAVAHVDELENASYSDLKEMVKVMEETHSRLPIAASDEALAQKIQFWKNKLSTTQYSELPLAAMGEIDFIVQTEVLKWNEVERERRMRDPIFVQQFEKLRMLLFPEGFSETFQAYQRKEKVKDIIFKWHDIDSQRFKAAKPFYYEDYMYYFEKLVTNKTFFYLEERDREQFNEWAIDTLVFDDIIAKNTAFKTFLSKIRSHFFPMVRYTNMTFTLPSVEEFKQLLYDNDIGYQTTPEGKLYVRRFYLIPQLLFSRDIIDTKVVRGTDRQQEAAELLKDMRGARSLRSPTNGAVSVDPRALDKLFAIKDSDRDAADVDDPSSLKNSKTVLSPGALKAKRDEAVAAIAEIAKEEDESNDHKLLVDTPEWSKVLDRHNVKLPTTDLERERDELFASQEAFRLEESTSESEVYQFRRTRQENMLLVRARLFAAYEEKEAARRAAEWKARGVWLDLPRADIELLEPHQAKIMQKNYREANK